MPKSQPYEWRRPGHGQRTASVLDQQAGEHPQHTLLRSERVGNCLGEAGEKPAKVVGKEGIVKDRAADLRLATQDLRQRTGQDSGFEIEHPPGSRRAAHGIAVVHLAGINGDDIAGNRFDEPDAAPGTMGAGAQDADAEAIMGVPREGAIGSECESLDARNGGSKLLRPVQSARQLIRSPFSDTDPVER